MNKTRDDFSAKTIDTLAKRVAYICSRPECGRLTIGPSQDQNDKATTIGVAAHITAAAEQGPRYDGRLTAEQRSSIDNGIWLCANCSVLIDKQPATFTIEVLKGWKNEAEKRTCNRFLGEDADVLTLVRKSPTPIVEGELFWVSASKWNIGVSDKNDTSKPIYIADVIYFNRLRWEYKLLLVNNSAHIARNIAVASNKEELEITAVPKINHLNPLETLELDMKFQKIVEDIGTRAAEMINPTYPPELEDLRLTVTYRDDYKSHLGFEVIIQNGEQIYRDINN